MSPSTSVQLSVTVSGVSSAVVSTPGHVGASLTALTVIENVAALESTVPSLALKVKQSLPL